MIYRLIVRQVARGLRGGISQERMRDILVRRFSWRDAEWRDLVIADAQARNRAALLRKIHA